MPLRCANAAAVARAAASSADLGAGVGHVPLHGPHRQDQLARDLLAAAPGTHQAQDLDHQP
jgi:hypothetical protein